MRKTPYTATSLVMLRQFILSLIEALNQTNTKQWYAIGQLFNWSIETLTEVKNMAQENNVKYFMMDMSEKILNRLITLSQENRKRSPYRVRLVGGIEAVSVDDLPQTSEHTAFRHGDEYHSAWNKPEDTTEEFNFDY